jgi:TRAP-type C4-dicarboxylate transport system substrate-binding protein
MPGLPFTFKSSEDVFTALDGDLGGYIRAELMAKGLYAAKCPKTDPPRSI